MNYCFCVYMSWYIYNVCDLHIQNLSWYNHHIRNVTSNIISSTLYIYRDISDSHMPAKILNLKAV